MAKSDAEKYLAKFDTARMLYRKLDKIRKTYINNMEKGDELNKQNAVALYLIDKLALIPGTGESPESYGCIQLLVKHIKLNEECKVELDFMGKGSIRYYNQITVLKNVYKYLELFMEGKKDDDKLFDKLTPYKFNKYLEKFDVGEMLEIKVQREENYLVIKIPKGKNSLEQADFNKNSGNVKIINKLTGKVFRTYHASRIFEKALTIRFKHEGIYAKKMEWLKLAKLAVAIRCNHKHTKPEMKDNRSQKVDILNEKFQECNLNDKDVKDKNDNNLEKDLDTVRNMLENSSFDKVDELLERYNIKSDENDIDPRISVSWKKRWGIDEFDDKENWAMNATKDYRFLDLSSDKETDYLTKGK